MVWRSWDGLLSKGEDHVSNSEIKEELMKLDWTILLKKCDEKYPVIADGNIFGRPGIVSYQRTARCHHMCLSMN